MRTLTPLHVPPHAAALAGDFAIFPVWSFMWELLFWARVTCACLAAQVVSLYAMCFLSLGSATAGHSFSAPTFPGVADGIAARGEPFTTANFAHQLRVPDARSNFWLYTAGNLYALSALPHWAMLGAGVGMLRTYEFVVGVPNWFSPIKTLFWVLMFLVVVQDEIGACHSSGGTLGMFFGSILPQTRCS
jgi:hypothetical protein